MGAHSDIVRLFLALIDVHHQSGNFNTDQFLQFYSNMILWMQSCVIEPLSKMRKPEANIIDNQILQTLAHLLEQQQLVLQVHNFMPHLAAKLILDWQDMMKSYDKNNHHYFWLLKGFVLLAYPFMPEFCEKIWHALGYEGKPSIYYFDRLPINSCKDISHLKMKMLLNSDLFKLKPQLDSKVGVLI